MSNGEQESVLPSFIVSNGEQESVLPSFIVSCHCNGNAGDILTYLDRKSLHPILLCRANPAFLRICTLLIIIKRCLLGPGPEDPSRRRLVQILSIAPGRHV